MTLPYKSRAFSTAADFPRMLELAQAEYQSHLHVIDLPYRFSSWAFDQPENTRLWFDAAGNLAAWAVLQPPFWSLDLVVRADQEASLFRETISWAQLRALQVAGSPYGRPSWFVNVFADQFFLRAELEAEGFVSQDNAGEGSWSKVFLRCPQDKGIPNFLPPEGYNIRPLAGEDEIDAYVCLQHDVFESKNMTVEWRRRTLQRSEYRPGLDLVAVAPDGSLAAFCVGWFAKDLGGFPAAQVEPLGVHPQYQGIGLGKTILVENLRRMRSLGASQIFVETDLFRGAALGVYASVGFQPYKEVLVYRWDV
jgi:mycothiol synthase